MSFQRFSQRMPWVLNVMVSVRYEGMMVWMCDGCMGLEYTPGNVRYTKQFVLNLSLSLSCSHTLTQIHITRIGKSRETANAKTRAFEAKANNTSHKQKWEESERKSKKRGKWQNPKGIFMIISYVSYNYACIFMCGCVGVRMGESVYFCVRLDLWQDFEMNAVKFKRNGKREE